jgi:GNAT superfamily N-acetyltransferase
VIRSIAFIAACVFAGACAAQPPHKLTLTYELSYNGIVAAEMTDVLEHDGKRFSLSSEGRGKGIGALLYHGTAKRWCRGEITSTGLRPLEYREQRGDKPASVAKFDWIGKTLTLEHDGKSETTRLVPGMQDRLSFLYNFAFEAAPDLKPGKQIKVTATDGRGLTRFQYTVAAPEMLKTPAGEFETVHLVKQRENDEDKGTELWFARDRDYLPVRILVVDKDGARLDQVLTHIGN